MSQFIVDRFFKACCTSTLKTLAKGETARKRAISPFPTVLSTVLDNFPPFSSNLKLLSATSFSLEESKICCLGKGLTI